MRKHGFVLLLGSLVLAAPVLVAQTPAAPAASTASSAPKVKSKEEYQALQSINKLAQTPTTTPAEMDAAITNFITKFPTSDFRSSVSVLGLRYYQDPAHTDYAKSLVYGEQALKTDPNELYALITLGTIIPDNVHDTDLDRDQRLQEATQDDEQALALAEKYAATGTVNGQPFTADIKNSIEADAYGSLARIATIKKDYAGAVADYAKAIPLDDGPHQAQDYFYTARAQMAMKQWPQALASLDAAEKAAPDNVDVKNAVESNRKLVQAEMGQTAGASAPAAAGSTPATH